jgi:formamidopyrimidine-DNA glycosylase
MPEIPDLEVIKEILVSRAVGRAIEAVQVLKPIILRVLDPTVSPSDFLVGRQIVKIARRGKFLVIGLNQPDHLVVINFMLAGHLRLCPRAESIRVRDYLVWQLSDGTDLRYHDDKAMGKVYLTHDLASVPGWADMGPDALDPALTPELFIESLRPHRGEIKGILTRGACVAGIGNAYADEILFRAGIYPFRKRTSLSRSEQAALFAAMRQVLAEATDVVRQRMGSDTHLKVRDFLAVHGKKGQPCPVCGQPISEVRAAKRATNFCRRCQPGTLVRN